jgi:RNA polymerase sigma-70 factor, ECF subfamily
VHEEVDLAQAFVAHEAWAYEAAYRVHHRVLNAAAMQVLGNEQEAQDCVHDVLERLWKRRAAFHPARGSLPAFLAVCVRNDALSRSRKAHNRERIEHLHEASANQPDIAGDVVQRESVRRALEELTDNQRQTIELSYFQRMTHAEIASRLGEPVGTVKSRLSAALRRLHQIFSTEGLNDG